MTAQTRNAEPHQYDLSSAPPTIGPAATATPLVAPHRPIARARAARSWNRLEMIDRVVGKITAAPRPARARQAMSVSGVLLHALPREPARYVTSPISSAPLRPNRSLSEPAASTNPANTRLKTSTIHSRSPVVADSSLVRVGSETFTIMVARLMVNEARHSTASASRGCEVDMVENLKHSLYFFNREI